MLRLAITVTFSAALGCAADPSFHCLEDAQCGARGRCEDVGYCSVEDAACSAGLRYEAHAGDLAGKCLERSVLEIAVTDDTRVDESATANNYGISDSLPCNEQVPRVRSLVRFELQQLPVDTTIERVELVIVATGNDGNSVSLYPILEAWTEGTRNTAPGAPSWIERAPSTPWGRAGLEASPSVEAVASATIPPSVSDQIHVVEILDRDRIRSWRADPSSNHGWLLRSDGGNGVSFHSSEAADLGKRPVLKIQFRK